MCHRQQLDQQEGERATGQKRWVERLAPPRHLPDDKTLLVASEVQCFGQMAAGIAAVGLVGTAVGFDGTVVDFAETVVGFYGTPVGFVGIAVGFDGTAVVDYAETVSFGIGIVAAGAGFVGTAADAAGTEEKSAPVKILLIYLKLMSSCWLELILFLLLLLWL